MPEHRRLRDAVSPDSRVSLVHSTVRELPHARNLALEMASFPVVLFLDDDVRLDPGCLDAHMRAFENPEVGGVVGSIRERRVRPNRRGVGNDIGPGGRVLTNLQGSGTRPVGSLKGCNMSFRRERLIGVGGFDRRFGGTAFLEDADASERVRRTGAQLLFVGDGSLEHLSEPSGGVRLPARVHQWWRFHNTGLFLAAHRSRIGVARGRVTFAAVAVSQAARWGDASAVAMLMGAFERGVALANTPPALSSEPQNRYNCSPETR